MFSVNYLLFDLVNPLGIMIWNFSHNVRNFYLHFRTFESDLCYCFLPCFWHALICVRLPCLLVKSFLAQEITIFENSMCFVFLSSPSVNSGYFCETLVIFVLVVEVGFVSWFSVEAIQVILHLFEEQSLFLLFFRYLKYSPHHLPHSRWEMMAKSKKAESC